MTAPRLSDTMRRTCDTLRQGAFKQVMDYEQKFLTMKNIYDEFLVDLIRTSFDSKTAFETAKEFFGDVSVRFAGIDGTMYSRPVFDMVIFFGGHTRQQATLAA